MRKRLSFLLCSAAGVMMLTPAQAAPDVSQEPVVATSYAELLEPVPNATAALMADEASRVSRSHEAVQLAQYHHHHHHHFYHHHHHHHHHGFFPGFGFSVGPSYGEDCYWVPGRPYWNGWRWVRRRVRVCD